MSKWNQLGGGEANWREQSEFNRVVKIDAIRGYIDFRGLHWLKCPFV